MKRHCIRCGRVGTPTELFNCSCRSDDSFNLRYMKEQNEVENYKTDGGEFTKGERILSYIIVGVMLSAIFDLILTQ